MPQLLGFDSEIHEGDIKLMCLCLHVVFQFSSFLLNLEMKPAIRTDTLQCVCYIIWNIQFISRGQENKWNDEIPKKPEVYIVS